MTHAHLDALRDQLAAVVREERPMPISTDRIAELATGKPHGWLIYRHLRILENRGLIGRLRLDNDNRAYWFWIASTYDRGAELGCPDCIGGEEHCCPYLWADEQPEPMRSWAFKHMDAALADIKHEITPTEKENP